MVNLIKYKETVCISRISDGFRDLSGLNGMCIKRDISALYKKVCLEMHTFKKGLC